MPVWINTGEYNRRDSSKVASKFGGDNRSNYIKHERYLIIFYLYS